MKISLTVKTLDSRNHACNDVDDGSTVKDFKERIASAVGIEAHLQRLIYRGRVLNDEKKLSDYSVDGKVVHLVQRPPPTGGPDRLAASEAQARSRGAAPGIGRHQIHFHHRRGPSSGGVLPFGAEGHPSALVRLNIARSMISRANEVIDSLSNGNQPAGAESSGPSDVRQPSASDNGASQPPGSDSDQNSSAGFAFVAPGIPATQGMTMTFSGAHGAGRFPPGLARAIQTAVNSAIGSTTGNSGQPVAMSFALGPNGQVVPISTATGERQPQNSSGQPPSSGSRDAAARSAPNGQTVNHPPPRILADVMNLYGQAQERLSPHWTRLSQVLTDDPTLESDAVVQEHQRLFDRVTEAMHFLSHAQHAMSDTMLNMSSATPRQLRARPFIIQSLVQSAAVVQQMPVSLVRSSRSANSTQATTAPATQSEEAAEEPMDTEASAAATTFTADVDNGVSGANVEVTMEPIVVGIEMGPEVTIDYNPATGRVDSSAPGTPTSAILEDVLNNIVGSMVPRSASSTSSSVATSSPSSSTVTSPPQQQQQQPSATATQDSRARGNTQTQPTTSTRTRLSTQVLTAPVAMGPPLGAFGSAGQPGNNFDIILPCNSHHIPGNFPTSRQIFRRAAYDRQRSASVPPPNRRGDSVAGSATPTRSQRGPGTGFRSVGESPVRQVTDVVNARCRLSRGENGSVSVNIERMVPSSVANAGQQRPQQGSGPDLESSLSTLLSELAQQPGGGENDDGMLNVISGIVRQVFAAMAGSGNGGQTISSFLESMPDYSYSRGEGVITDLLMTLARSLTFSDLVGFLGGSNAVIGRLQEPLRDFLLQRVLLLDRSCSTTPEPRETEEAVLRLLDDSFPSLAAAVETANVVEDVDFSETCFRFLSLRLTELALYVWQTPNDEFSAGFYDVCQKFMVDLTNLCLHCFSDGQASLERLLRNHLSSVSDDVASSSISSWTMSTAIGHFRTYIASLSQPADPSAIECGVIKTHESESMALARLKRQENRKEDKTEPSADTADDENFETPRTSPEVMDTDEIGQDGATTTEDQSSKAEVDAPPPATVEDAFPESLLPRSGMGSGAVLEKEPWHGQVPSEWVPVIARDIQLQNNVPAPAPYSDAYLSTQSAKRRKLAAGGKLDGNLKKVIEGTLQDAIKVAGVQPTTSKEEASKCVAANCKVEELVSDHTRGSIKRRLDQDKDYIPDKFASCKQFHEK